MSAMYFCFKCAVWMLLWTAVESLGNSSLCPDTPTCFCQRIGGKIDVRCEPVDSLDAVSNLLKTNFSQDNINVLGLNDCDVTELPAGIFGNTNISVLQSNCPLQDIQVGALPKVECVFKVSLIATVFKEIPMGLYSFPRLKILIIASHKIEKIDGELSTLPNLFSLNLRDGLLTFVSKDAFANTRKLTYLDLSHNQLEMLDPNVFDQLTNLKNLILSGNKLQTVDGLLKALNPEVIDLYDNKLENVDNVFHDGMWKVKILKLGRNRIRALNASAFANKILSVETLDLSQSLYTEMNPILLQTLKGLKTIELQFNQLQDIPEGFFDNLRKLESVNLQNNHIEAMKGLFTDNLLLRTIYLSHNNISSLDGTFQNLDELVELDLKYNKLSDVREGQFFTLQQLEKLDLSHNEIELIERYSFANLPKLKFLNLDRNHFSVLNYSIRNLPELEEFTATIGAIQGIEKDELIGLPRLSSLNLARNEIKSINGAFKKLSSLRKLYISSNRLQTISSDTLPANFTPGVFTMGGNPLSCDCRLEWLVKWIQQTNGSVISDRPVCIKPENLHSRRLKSLTVQDITRWQDDCPRHCNCKCQTVGIDFYVTVNCSSSKMATPPDTLPEESREIYLDNNLLKGVVSLNLGALNRLQTLNLTYNSIKYLQWTLPDSMKVLFLDGNEMARLNVSTMMSQNWVEMTMSGNSWICDCETEDFKKWLVLHKDVIADINETRCANIDKNGVLQNKTIIYLDDLSLCPPKLKSSVYYACISIGTLAASILLVSSTFFCYRYRWNVSSWFYAKGLTFIKSPDPGDNERTFDALLLHHETDRDLAWTGIALSLEAGTPIFSIYPPRQLRGRNEDFDVDEVTNICRRVIVVLSREFVIDENCMRNFLSAYDALLINRHLHRLIVIKYEDLPPLESMHDKVQSILKPGRFITWGNRLFWQMLIFAMPKQSSDDDAASVPVENQALIAN